MRESQWTAKVCRELERVNALVLPIIGGSLQRPGRKEQYHIPVGWPDRYVHHAHWSGFLEFKGLHTEVELHQCQRMGQLNSRVPGSAFIVRLVEKSPWRGTITYIPGVNYDESECLGEFTSGKQLMSELRKISAEVRRAANGRG